jgi:hypothetical protein
LPLQTNKNGLAWCKMVQNLIIISGNFKKQYLAESVGNFQKPIFFWNNSKDNFLSLKTYNYENVVFVPSHLVYGIHHA